MPKSNNRLPQYNEAIPAELTLEHIIAHMPGHVYWKSKEGVYLGCNDKQAKSLGLNNGSEVVGKTDFDLPWNEQDANIFRENDLEVINSGQYKIAEEHAKVDGKDAIVLSQKVPLRNKQGEVVGILGISLDITERKHQEEQKAAFLNVVSHEIRGPLNNIQGLTQLLELTKNLKKQDAAQIVNDVISEVKRATGLLSDMVDLFDPNFTKDEVRYVDNVNLAQVIDSITPEINFKPDTKFIIEIGPTVPRQININVIKLRNILKILLQNSAEQTQKGHIKLLVNTINVENKPALYVELLDTSSGIYPANKDFVFNALGAHHPLDKDFLYHKPHIKLTMAKRLIESIGGAISLLDHPGKGSEFEIVIPYQPVTADKNIPVSTYKPLASDQGSPIVIPAGLKVLIVEDDKITNQLLTKMFKQFKCKVKQVYMGKAALAALQKQKYDLISLDITLPDINGAQVLKHLPKDTTPAVVAITSHATKADVDYLYSQGFMAVLTKPVNQDDIENLLEAYTRMLQEDQ